MDSALTPREIQARIRGGASVSEVAEEAGVDAERIEGFAGPVLAEREHMTRTALGATVRRRGDGTGHRRLADVIRERLQVRGIDSDQISWDSWRRSDLRWQLVGTIADEAAPRSAEFIFDHRGRFNVADNPDARWMIGEELPGAEGPDNENTVDFNDELALVRATQDPLSSPASIPGDDVPPQDALYEDSPQTSELDDLYDMMSGISEDSVRIYVGLEDESGDGPPVPPASEVTESPEAADPTATGDAAAKAPEDQAVPAPGPGESEADPEGAADPEGVATIAGAEQDTLLEEGAVEEPARPKPARRRRAKVPSWDEIMFGGGPTKDA